MFSRFIIGSPVGVLPQAYLSKNDLLGIGTAIAGLAGAGASLRAANLNYKSQQETNAMNYKIAQETNQANRDLYAQQFRDQVHMWNMENKYNSPTAQRERLAAAGLNPALNGEYANQAGSMTVPSASPAVGAQMQAPQYSDIGASIMNAVQGVSSATKDFAEAQGISTDNQYRDAMNEAQLNSLSAKIEEALSYSHLNKQQKENLLEAKEGIQLQNYLTRYSMSDTLQQKELQTKQMSLQNIMLDEQAKNIRQDTILKRAQTAFQIDENSRQFTRLSKELQKMDSEMALMASQGVLNSYSAAKVFHDTVGQVLSNQQAAKIMPFVTDIYQSDAKTARATALRTTIESRNPFTYFGNPGSNLKDIGIFLKYAK